MNATKNTNASDRGPCPQCGERAIEIRPYTHVQKVGAFTVKDPTGMAPHCANCGAQALNLDELSVYERDAAKIALLDGKYDGAVVKFARKAIGLTQAQLGVILDYSPEMISKLENGKEAVQKSYALALVGLLKMTPEEIGEALEQAESQEAHEVLAKRVQPLGG